MPKNSKKKRSSNGLTESRTGGLSVRELTDELRRRERQLGTLKRRRERAMAKVRDLDAQISSLSGETDNANGRRRPRNDVTLADAMASVLDGYEMSVTELADAVREAGYKTTSPNFRVIVNQTLLKDTRFVRVSRGIYSVA